MSSQGTILISYIGYITQEIKVDKNDKLIITLEEDTETLDEVVVVAMVPYKNVRYPPPSQL